MSERSLEVLFSPVEFESLARRDLSATTCVVFDVLRATSSIVTALANGASAVFPVETIEEALRLRNADPELLLAGERHGLRITRELTGSIDFDFGNSPREFTPARVTGRSIAMTTTNGTRALRACRHAREVLVGSFLNLGAGARYLREQLWTNLLLVCSGTYEQAAYEDTIAAGALAEALWPLFEPDQIADSAQLARNCYLAVQNDLLGAMEFARNGRRLLELPALKEDVPFCLRRDTTPVLAHLTPAGALTVV